MLYEAISEDYWGDITIDTGIVRFDVKLDLEDFIIVGDTLNDDNMFEGFVFGLHKEDKYLGAFERFDDFPLLYHNYYVGQKWYSKISLEQHGEENASNREIISISETVTVPAGTFINCIVIKYADGNEPYSYLYFRKDIGIIKIESVDDSFSMKLISKNF